MKKWAGMILWLALCVPTGTQPDYPDHVSLIQLIANPEKYDGKFVRVIGFLRLEFEGNVLYLHQEDYQHGIGKNGLWADLTGPMKVDVSKASMNYVLIEGTFEAGRAGHLSLYGGTITEVNRCEIWSKPGHPRRVRK